MPLQVALAHEKLHGLQGVDDVLVVVVLVFCGVAFVDGHAQVECGLDGDIKIIIKIMMLANLVEQERNAVVLQQGAVFVRIEADILPLVTVLAAEGIINLILIHLFKIFGKLEILIVFIEVLSLVDHGARTILTHRLGSLFFCWHCLVAVVLLIYRPFRFFRTLLLRLFF